MAKLIEGGNCPSCKAPGLLYADAESGNEAKRDTYHCNSCGGRFNADGSAAAGHPMPTPEEVNAFQGDLSTLQGQLREANAKIDELNKELDAQDVVIAQLKAEATPPSASAKVPEAPSSSPAEEAPPV